MSTRSVVGVFTGKQHKHWHGRYIHHCGEPEGNGQWLFKEYQRAFRGNLQAMVDKLLAEKIGWSLIYSCDLTMAPNWTERLYGADYKTRATLAPQSYTARGEHDDRPDGYWVKDTGDNGGCVYAYIFDVEAEAMHVFEYDYDEAYWRRLCIVYLGADKLPAFMAE